MLARKAPRGPLASLAAPGSCLEPTRSGDGPIRRRETGSKRGWFRVARGSPRQQVHLWHFGALRSSNARRAGCQERHTQGALMIIATHYHVLTQRKSPQMTQATPGGHIYWRSFGRANKGRTTQQSHWRRFHAWGADTWKQEEEKGQVCQ